MTGFLETDTNTEYNGYPNRDTWSLSLYANNDQHSYERFMELAADRSRRMRLYDALEDLALGMGFRNAMIGHVTNQFIEDANENA